MSAVLAGNRAAFVCSAAVLTYGLVMVTSSMSVQQWKIERRANGVLIVRVPSENRNGEALPDAVFSFRAGDPQYQLWEQRFWEQGDEMESRTNLGR